MKTNKVNSVFGYSWDSIRELQQGRGRLAIAAPPIPRKETLYKTARAVVGCAQFHPGEIVSLAFYHFDEEGKAWYLIERSERGPLAQPVAYPASLLKDFCL